MLGFPTSYRDPLYTRLARAAEMAHNIPSGILDAIRTQGERSNADQVSSAGARGPYQFIPATRRGMMRNYHVDPWHDAGSQTEAAALHVLESFNRTHNWDSAVAGYHGGIKAEHGHGGRQNRAYTARVGSFNGEQSMGASLYPERYYGRDPLAPEPVKDTAPVVNDPGPSTPIPAAAPAAAKKRGGLLGALESVFMPDADSRYAAALRGGIWDAKANQQLYKEGQAKQAVDLETANVKLKNLMTKGEFTVVGNNVFHVAPDGTHEMITAPATKTEHMLLLDQWRGMDDSDPAKKLIERMLTGANSDDVLAARAAAAAETARIRAGATTGAATIRAQSTGKTQNPPTGFIVDQ